MKHKKVLSPLSGLLNHRIDNVKPWRVQRESSLEEKLRHDELRTEISKKYCQDVPNDLNQYPSKHQKQKKHNDIRFDTIDANEAARHNTLGIQMIPKVLQEKLFPHPPDVLDQATQRLCATQLKEFGLNQAAPNPSKSVDISLPEGTSNITEFFSKIALEQLTPYSEYISKLTECIDLPSLPSEWSRNTGWTKYTDTGPISVSWPECHALVFDVEVCIQNGNNLPSLAVAMSPDYVYSWTSPALEKPWLYNRNPTTELLVPFGPEPKLIVGHHVMYDRARVAEEYRENRSKLRFLDTQSLHVCVSGLENNQKGQWLGANSNKELTKDWMKVGAPNSLAAVHKLYCGADLDKSTRDIFVSGSHHDVQKMFQSLVTYCANDVVATFNVLKEVWKLYAERFPSPVTLAGMFEMASCFIPTNKNWNRYVAKSDATFYEMQGEIKKVLALLADEVLLRYHLNKEKTLQDPWMSQLNWNSKKILGVKNKKLSVKAQLEDDIKREEERRKPMGIARAIDKVCNDPSDKPKHYTGAPEWYRSLCPKANSYFDISWNRCPLDISLSTAVAPLLLQLAYCDHPLYRTHHHGWGYLVSISNEEKIRRQALVNEYFPGAVILDKHSCHEEYKLPANAKLKYEKDIGSISSQMEFFSKRGENSCLFIQYDFKKMSLNAHQVGNVGNPLGKGFTDSIEEGIISSFGSWEAQQVLTLGIGLTSWRNTRSRIISQFVVELKDSDFSSREANSVGKKDLVGAILPQVVPAGTITRRATEQLWLTASNVRPDRVGSEFKGVVTPFPGYCFVGADVDSQELWIASLIGDSKFGEHGATPLGWMSLQGQKSSGTDMHSITAAELSQGRPGLVSRNIAKAFNYARIYGSGKGLARSMLRDCSKELSDDEISSIIDRMFQRTKGRQMYQLTKLGKRQAAIHDLNLKEISAQDLENMSKLTGFSPFQLANHRLSRYSGGSESAMFNKLEEIAKSKHPATPFLGSRITRTLEPDVILRSYQLNSRINWVVQSSAVDFLHLLLVCMKWLMTDYQIPGRFALSIHDEVRFHIPLEYRYEAALALQISNLLTRAFFSSQLGIYDLPNNVAFFSGVDIDRSLRKDVHDECITPSNPHGLALSYGIEPGEELDIFALLEKANILKARE